MMLRKWLCGCTARVVKVAESELGGRSSNPNPRLNLFGMHLCVSIDRVDLKHRTAHMNLNIGPSCED